ncbi:MAG: alpha/beta fold hydrolase, partial [Longimicrobiales bacterium]
MPPTLSSMDDPKYSDAACVIPVDPGGFLTPVFLVHGADGDVQYAHALAGLLPSEQPVWGVRMEGFATRPPPHRSVEELARHYVSELKAARPNGPYAVGGYSIGGTIAFEMGRQLEAAGDLVSLILLIDARFPPLADVPAASKSYNKVGVWPRPRRGRLERIWRRQVSDRVKRLIVKACTRFGWPLPSLWSIRTRYFWRALAAARDRY